MTSILMVANKNLFWKKQVISSLFLTWKLANTISNVLRVEPSIF